jgi:hypothetical protein
MGCNKSKMSQSMLPKKTSRRASRDGFLRAEDNLERRERYLFFGVNGEEVKTVQELKERIDYPEPKPIKNIDVPWVSR